MWFPAIRVPLCVFFVFLSLGQKVFWLYIPTYISLMKYKDFKVLHVQAASVSDKTFPSQLFTHPQPHCGSVFTPQTLVSVKTYVDQN